MPLSARARIEIFLPDQPQNSAYQTLLNRLRRELTYGFGGCTLLRGIEGSYLSLAGRIIEDRLTLLFADIPYSLEMHFEMVSQYAETLRQSAFEALEEEKVLIVVSSVRWSE